MEAANNNGQIMKPQTRRSSGGFYAACAGIGLAIGIAIVATMDGISIITMTNLLPALGVALAAFFVWLTVRIISSNEWSARATLSVISVAGVAAICAAYHLPRHFARDRIPLPKEYRQVLGITVLPTVIFVAAALVSWSSVKLQRAVAITAALVGALSVGGSLLTLSGPQHGGTGMGSEIFALISWIVGAGVSAVLLLIGAANYGWRSWHPGASPSTDDSGRK